MTTTLISRLERLKNRTTMYEYVMTDWTTTYLVVYAGQSRRRLLSAIRGEKAEKIIEIAGTNEMTIGKGASFQIGAWTIRLSGRTQRNAYIDGELTFILDVEKKI